MNALRLNTWVPETVVYGRSNSGYWTHEDFNEGLPLDYKKWTLVHVISYDNSDDFDEGPDPCCERAINFEEELSDDSG